MKKAFTIYVEDDCNLKAVQMAVCVQRKNDEEKVEKNVTFFSLADDIRENDEWLFKVNGSAERIVTGEPQEGDRKE